MLQTRLQKISDEYFGGISTWYMTSKTMLDEGLKLLEMLKEDAGKMAAANLHELMRCWRTSTGSFLLRHMQGISSSGRVQISRLLLQGRLRQDR